VGVADEIDGEDGEKETGREWTRHDDWAKITGGLKSAHHRLHFDPNRAFQTVVGI
jgi:hypothetical protein